MFAYLWHGFLMTAWVIFIALTISSIIEISVLKIAKKLLQFYFELKFAHLRKINTEFDETERRSTFRAGLN